MERDTGRPASGHRRPSVSLDLTARAAVIARRLGDLLAETCTDESGASGTVAFLRSFADAAVADDIGAESPPIDLVTSRFELTEVEVTLILLAGLPDEHEGVATTFRMIHPRAEPRPTAGLAAQLLTASHPERSELRALLVAGRAVRFGLLKLGDEGPFYERSLILADGLWDALHGHDGVWPGSLERVDLVVPPAGLEAWIELPEVARARAALLSREDRTVMITALDEAIAASRVATLARSVNLPTVAARLERPDRADIGLVVLYAAARGALPVVLLHGPSDVETTSAARLDLSELPGPVIVCAVGGAVRPVGIRPVLTVPVGPISTAARRRSWQVALPDLAERSDELAARHPLDPAVTSEVAADVRSRQRLAGGLRGIREVSEVIRARAGVTLAPGIQLETPDVSWARLILPSDAVTQLVDLVTRLQHQSTVLDDWGFRDEARADRGVRLMFTGPPGTGKSLAAEVVASAAGTDLLVVDVSQVVSKWIGETEKNLARVFDVAERTQAVLLLDEADALFATRTEVGDAHDRYANLQTAYLLQRLDHFDGLTILATNLRQNIDPAFQRRMDDVIEFKLPDAALRRRLWQVHLPERAPIAADLDVDLFAALYPVAGAWIRNAAIAAGFLAAAEGVPIDAEHLVRAMRREYEKASRPFPGRPEPMDVARSNE